MGLDECSQKQFDSISFDESLELNVCDVWEFCLVTWFLLVIVFCSYVTTEYFAVPLILFLILLVLTHNIMQFVRIHTKYYDVHWPSSLFNVCVSIETHVWIYFYQKSTVTFAHIPFLEDFIYVKNFIINSPILFLREYFDDEYGLSMNCAFVDVFLFFIIDFVHVHVPNPSTTCIKETSRHFSSTHTQLNIGIEIYIESI